MISFGTAIRPSVAAPEPDGPGAHAHFSLFEPPPHAHSAPAQAWTFTSEGLYYLSPCSALVSVAALVVEWPRFWLRRFLLSWPTTWHLFWQTPSSASLSTSSHSLSSSARTSSCSSCSPSRTHRGPLGHPALWRPGDARQFVGYSISLCFFGVYNALLLQPQGAVSTDEHLTSCGLHDCSPHRERHEARMRVYRYILCARGCLRCFGVAGLGLTAATFQSCPPPPRQHTRESHYTSENVRRPPRRRGHATRGEPVRVSFHLSQRSLCHRALSLRLPSV